MASDDDTYAEWIKTDPPPDLQELVRKAGQRRAAQLGEPCDPLNKPEHGGYPHITAEEWAAHDRDMAAWEIRRRDRLKGRR